MTPYKAETIELIFVDIINHINEERSHRLAIALLLLAGNMTSEELKTMFEQYITLTELT